MKYKEGDRITFRNDLIVGRFYGTISFNEPMLGVIGKTFTIQDGPTRDGNYTLYINADEDFYYSPEMFSITNSKLFTLL